MCWPVEASIEVTTPNLPPPTPSMPSLGFQPDPKLIKAKQAPGISGPGVALQTQCLSKGNGVIPGTRQAV